MVLFHDIVVAQSAEVKYPAQQVTPVFSTTNKGRAQQEYSESSPVFEATIDSHLILSPAGSHSDLHVGDACRMQHFNRLVRLRLNISRWFERSPFSGTDSFSISF